MWIQRAERVCLCRKQLEFLPSRYLKAPTQHEIDNRHEWAKLFLSRGLFVSEVLLFSSVCVIILKRFLYEKGFVGLVKTK